MAFATARSVVKSVKVHVVGELISTDSVIDPLVTSHSGVCCKRTSVSHPAGKAPQSVQMSLGSPNTL